MILIGVAMESVFNTNTKTAMLVALARGVLYLHRQHNKQITAYTPPQVKPAYGYGRAEKKKSNTWCKSY